VTDANDTRDASPLGLAFRGRAAERFEFSSGHLTWRWFRDQLRSFAELHDLEFECHQRRTLADVRLFVTVRGDHEAITALAGFARALMRGDVGGV
jgi:hypothetical protein